MFVDVESAAAPPSLGINVIQYGADPTGVADSTTAFAAAIAAAVAATPHRKVYFPAGTYKGSIVVQDIDGLLLEGEGTATKVTSANNATALDIFGSGGSAGSGNVKHIIVRDMSFVTSGASGIGVRLLNALGVTLENLVSTGGLPYTIQGSGLWHLNNCQGFAGSNTAALYIGNAVDTLTDSGPGVVTAGTYQNQSATAIPAVKVLGDPTGIVFTGVMFTGNISTEVGIVIIDGGGSPAGGINNGSVDFVGCYAESTYNSANTAATFMIGNSRKFGHVGIYGGVYRGHGNGTNYMRDFVRVVAAHSVAVRNVNVNKSVAANGFSRSMIRLESTFPAAGDVYSFCENTGEISGTMYSDANGVLVKAQTAWLDANGWSSAGLARFRAKCTVSAGVPTLAEGENVNVGGITDTALGQITIAFAQAFATANWTPMAIVQGIAVANINSMAAGSVIVDCRASNTQALADPASWFISGLGRI